MCGFKSVARFDYVEAFRGRIRAAMYSCIWPAF